jgi:hypothetical protein
MIDLSATLEAELEKQAIRLSYLIKFDFLSGVQRYWLGQYPLVTGGFTWTSVPTAGTPVLVALDLGAPSINGSAENFTINVSGVSSNWVSRVAGTQAEFIGRAVEVWLQFFDAAWQPLDSPFMIRSGRMLGASYSIKGPFDPASIVVKCESKFTARGLPPLGYLSPNDQKARFPGNTSLDEIPGLQDHTVQWPYFPPPP